MLAHLKRNKDLSVENALNSHEHLPETKEAFKDHVDHLTKLARLFPDEAKRMRDHVVNFATVADGLATHTNGSLGTSPHASAHAPDSEELAHEYHNTYEPHPDSGWEQYQKLADQRHAAVPDGPSHASGSDMHYPAPDNHVTIPYEPHWKDFDPSHRHVGWSHMLQHFIMHHKYDGKTIVVLPPSGTNNPRESYAIWMSFLCFACHVA